ANAANHSATVDQTNCRACLLAAPNRDNRWEVHSRQDVTPHSRQTQPDRSTNRSDCNANISESARTIRSFPISSSKARLRARSRPVGPRVCARLCLWKADGLSLEDATAALRHSKCPRVAPNGLCHVLRECVDARTKFARGAPVVPARDRTPVVSCRLSSIPLRDLNGHWQPSEMARTRPVPSATRSRRSTSVRVAGTLRLRPSSTDEKLQT